MVSVISFFFFDTPLSREVNNIDCQLRCNFRCFLSTVCRELVDKHPSPHTCLLLGDAYMSVQEVGRLCGNHARCLACSQ